MEFDFIKTLFNSSKPLDKNSIDKAAKIAMEFRSKMGIIGLELSAQAEKENIPPMMFLTGLIVAMNDAAREMENLLFTNYASNLTDAQKEAVLSRLQKINKGEERS